MPIGEVTLTIVDNGSQVVVPSANVQLVMGCSSAGTVAAVAATSNPNTVKTLFGVGPMPEAACMALAKGGVAVLVKTTSNTPGANTAVVFTGTGTSVVTVTGVPNDFYLVEMLVDTAGTIGTTGIRVKISLDGGKSYGPLVSLGTATTLVLTDTGLTLNFAAGTLVAGDKARFSTTGPLWNTAGVQAAFNAFKASQYGSVGVGSVHLVGPVSGADAATIGGYVTTAATNDKIFTRLIANAVDVTTPTAWGGAGGQTEAAWMTALATGFSAVDQKRMSIAAGHYNMASQITNPIAGNPRYRRPLSFAYAARQIAIPPQRHAGKVKDGSLSDIIVDPNADPVDGFVYHDERQNPGLDAARFVTARTRIKKQGYYIHQPNLMSATGSVFSLLPIGTVMDVACGIATDVGQDVINDDVLLNVSGTIHESEAQTIEKTVYNAIKDNMIARNMISAAKVVVDRTVNVLNTSKVRLDITIVRRGYVLEEEVYIQFGALQAT